MTLFDAVADEYDAGRPSYPDGVYDALGPLDGMRVLEIGAGTGIATRQLLARGASVVAVDAGTVVLERAARRSPGLRAVVADGANLPLRSECAELVCCAQSWHWLDPATRVDEMYRVLVHRGRWAAWWTHSHVDEEAWFDDYWSVIESVFPAVNRAQRDTDWGATISASNRFEVADIVVVRWTRVVPVDTWLTDQASHSYVAALPEQERDELLARLRVILEAKFGNGDVRAAHTTSLWIATKK